MSRADLRLYAVATPQAMCQRDPVDAVLAAVAGGATLVQLRDKESDARSTVELARALRSALPREVPLVVNDRVDIAHAGGADGVHLGQRDLSPAAARAVLGNEALVGLTIHHPHEAVTDARLDYAGLGPVFATSSKDPGDPPLGVDGLAELSAAVRERLEPLPMCAIAGIDRTRAPAVIEAGVDGIAVIGALFHAADIRAAAVELRSAVDQALASRTTR